MATHFCNHCNKILSNVSDEAIKYNVWCSDCTEANKELFKEKDLPYGGKNSDGYSYWGEIESNKIVGEIPNLSSYEGYTEKCDHCNKSLNTQKAPTRYDNSTLWCAECVREEADKFIKNELDGISSIDFNTNSTASRWSSAKYHTILKACPPKGQMEKFVPPTTPCNHCGVALFDRDIDAGWGAPWCKSCFTEDKALLQEHDIRTGNFSKDGNVQFWQASIDLVKEIPKKVVKVEAPKAEEPKIEEEKVKTKSFEVVACTHCNKSLNFPTDKWTYNKKYYTLWCHECHEQNKNQLIEMGITINPSHSTPDLHMWMETDNVEKINSIPQKSVEEAKIETPSVSKVFPCDHCNKSIDLTGLRLDFKPQEHALWCNDCRTENSRISSKQKYSYHSGLWHQRICFMDRIF